MLTIRGHHLFCLLEPLCSEDLKVRFFESHKTLNSVAICLYNEPDIPVQIVAGPDDICIPCEWWNAEKGYCIKEPGRQLELLNIRMQMDNAAIPILDMKQGEILPAVNLFKRIKSMVSKEIMAEKICFCCPDVNICCETYDEKVASTVRRLCSKG